MKLNEHDLLNIIRMNELCNQMQRLEAQKDLIVELDLEDTYEKKLDQLDDAILTINDLIGVLVKENHELFHQGNEKLGKKYGVNMFKWVLESDVIEHSILHAAMDGMFSDSIKEISGYSVRTAHLYPDE